MKAHLYGEGAIFVDLEIDDDPRRGARTLAAAAYLRAALPQADVVVGAGAVVLSGVGPWDALDGVVAGAARAAAEPNAEDDAGELVEIPVVYDGADLAEIARALGVKRDDVIALHANPIYRAELVGFLPGFAYLTGVDPRLALPRRASPRPRVERGSVAIAGGFTGVYPSRSPGGWHLLGRTDTVMFDPARSAPTRVMPGARVRFVPASGGVSFRDAEVLAPVVAVSHGLEIERAPAMATVQDGGRGGRLGEGLPPSGPLDPAAHAAANLALGNPPNAGAIEVPLGVLEVRARGDTHVSIDGAPPLRLRDGERLRVPTAARAVRYLAIGGGVTTARVLGAQATLVAAAIGGLGGRALRRGDVVPTFVAAERATAAARPGTPDDPATPAILYLDLGPHEGHFPAGALDALLSRDVRVSPRGDRTGVRLDGVLVPAPRALALPVPMVRGAIEIPSDGVPIVLGPDHPTTGGYAVLAVLRRVSQALLARCPPGHPVRFVLA